MILYTRKHKIPFQIDEDDLEIISRYSWCVLSSGYLMTKIPKFDNRNNRIKQHSMLMHNLLLGVPPKDLEWDHENQDPLDNRRKNLRAITHSENCKNYTPGRCKTGRLRGRPKKLDGAPTASYRRWKKLTLRHPKKTAKPTRKDITLARLVVKPGTKRPLIGWAKLLKTKTL